MYMCMGCGVWHDCGEMTDGCATCEAYYTEHDIDQCPTCGRDTDIFVQAVPGDPDAEYVCRECDAYWRATHVWDDAEGTWIDREGK